MTVTPLLPNDSVAKIFWHRVQDMGSQIAMRQKVRGLWKPVSWTRYGARTRGLGLGLAAQGLGRQDRVVIVAKPSPIWMMAEMAVLAMGGIAVPVDPDCEAEQALHILRDCGASFCLVENWVAAEDLFRRHDEVPALKKIIVMEAGQSPEPHDPMILSLRDLIVSGHQAAGLSVQKTWEASIEATEARDVALLAYAPGEASPTGAMITHDNLVFQMMAGQAFMPLGARDRVMSFLNPAEMTRHLFDVFYHLVFGFTLYFPESVSSVRRDMKEVQPTVFLAPLENWQDLHGEVSALVRTAPALQRLAVRAATALGRKRVQREVNGHSAPLWLLGAEAPFRPLVHKRIRRWLGLGACRLALGQADTDVSDHAEWAQILGLEWVWALGQAETTGLTLVRSLTRRRLMCDGPLPQTQLRTAPDGTLSVSGRHVCQGAWPVFDKKPFHAEEAWFATRIKLDERGDVP